MNDEQVPVEQIDLKLSKKKSNLSTDKPSKKPKKAWSKKKKILVFGGIFLFLVAAAVGGFFLYQYLNPEVEIPFVAEKKKKEEVHYYSTLTGEEIASPDLDKLPTFCIQIPNGLDGPRPQAGLNQAAIVFEAIAEAGITRFAAIFQNPTASAIGPVRSIRPYYVEWDTPFDCTVVHAGGSYDALQRLANDGYRDLSENYAYEWRDYVGYYAPNNLMTSSGLLKQFNADNGFESSDVKSFTRMTPAAAEKARKKALKATENTTEKDENGNEVVKSGTPLVTNISVNFGYTPSFNTVYSYDQASNTYLRSFADGTPHTTYTCAEDLEEPSPQRDCGEAEQVAPKVIAVLVSDQYLDSDGYHQVIPTTGSGRAYIFQNGTAVEATWTREDFHDPIKFIDENDKEIKLVPGQLWVAAIPASTGSVEY